MIETLIEYAKSQKLKKVEIQTAEENTWFEDDNGEIDQRLINIYNKTPEDLGFKLNDEELFRYLEV